MSSAPDIETGPERDGGDENAESDRAAAVLLGELEDDEDLPESDEDAEIDSEAPEDVAPEDSDEPPRTRVTAQDRIRNLTHEREELAEQNRLLRARADRERIAREFHQSSHAAAAREAEQEAIENERIAMLPEHERGEALYNQALSRQSREAARHQAQVEDQLDRMWFQQIAHQEKYPPSVIEEVEARFESYWAQGIQASRQHCLQEVLGHRHLEILGSPEYARARERHEERRQRRIASQTVRPSGRGSTAVTNGGRRGQNQDAEDEALLRSVTWGEVNR